MKKDIRLAAVGITAGVGLGVLSVAFASQMPQLKSNSPVQKDGVSNERSQPVGVTNPPVRRASTRTTNGELRDLLIELVASEGRVSILQMTAIAEIASAVRGREDEFLAAAQDVARANGGISLHQMSMLAGGGGLVPSYSVAQGNPYDSVGNGRTATTDPYPSYSSGNAASSSGSGASHESESASRRRLEEFANSSQRRDLQSGASRALDTTNALGAVNPSTGEFYAPAGQGYVSTRNGTYYTPAGPNGVIDTRTGQFIPTN